ncbi:hypothetical protein BC832DRAFT_202234 [Gaertneriomyces semiglobifer]|nr:hypothetical protein BC832DRAFT_202234 [Gaertneriomyces semiglobifer]
MPNQNQLTQSTLNFSPKAPQATRSDSTIRPSPPGRRSKLDLVHGNARPAPTPLVDLTGPFDVYCGTTSSPSKREQPPATMEKHANGRSAVINLTEASESTSSPRTLAAAANSGAALRAKLEHLTCAAGKKRPANEALLGAPTRPFEIAGKKRVPFGSASSKPTEALETAVNARSTLVAEKDGSVTMRSLAQARGNSQTSWSETQTRKTVNASTRSTSSARVLPSSFRSKGSSLSGSAEAPDVKLSPEQEHVAHLVINQKESLFFTGSAGTGKSVLLRKMIARLRKLHREEEIAITGALHHVRMSYHPLTQ